MGPCDLSVSLSFLGFYSFTNWPSFSLWNSPMDSNSKSLCLCNLLSLFVLCRSCLVVSVSTIHQMPQQTKVNQPTFPLKLYTLLEFLIVHVRKKCIFVWLTVSLSFTRAHVMRKWRRLIIMICGGGGGGLSSAVLKLGFNLINTSSNLNWKIVSKLD